MLEYHESFSNIKCPTVSGEGSTILAFTDTCAQTCVSGIELLRKLNLATDILLIPTSHKIIGVTVRNLDILGVLMVKLQRLQYSAQAAVFICNHINRIFVSSKIQMELGIIPFEYPNPRKSFAQVSEHSLPDEQTECVCLRRVKPPVKPDKIPFEPIIENREKLEQWIISRYRSSAFNTCEHQPIPKLSGRPFDIHVKPNPIPKQSTVQSQFLTTGKSR